MTDFNPTDFPKLVIYYRADGPKIYDENGLLVGMINEAIKIKGE